MKPQAHALPRRIAVAAALALGYFALAAISIELTRGTNRFAGVWLPNAIAVGLVLRAGGARPALVLPGLIAAGVLANLLVGTTPAAAFAFSIANGLEMALAVLLLRRWCGARPDPARLEFVGWFMLAACIIAPAAGTGMILIEQALLSETILSGQAAQWLVTNSLGMMLGLPSLLIIWDALVEHRVAGRQAAPNPQVVREFRWVMPLGLLVVVAVFAQSSYPFLFFCASVVVLFAYRLGLLATVLGTLWIALAAIIATAFDSGPIALMKGPFDHKLLVLQTFLACVFLTGVPVAAALNRKRHLLGQLRKQKRKLSLLANNITDAVLRYDMDGVCLDASPSVRTVLGRKPADFIGKRPDALTHPDAQEKVRDALGQLTGGATQRLRFTYRRLLDDDDGNPVHIEADCAVVDDRQFDEQTIIVCLRDVTERVELEAQLVRARRHAENAVAAKSQFLANMSHEIRTPMNGVLGFAELLQRADLPKEQARQVDLIAESGQTMMRLLNDILDISKIEAGQIATSVEPVDFSHLVDSCVKLQSANASNKGIALTSTIAPDIPPSICTDPLRLRQILLNLLGNAIKFTEDGGVNIDARSDGGGHLLIAVSDTGVGIPAERVEGIFQPFEQADNATSRKYGGTGLGLTISRQLADLLGGTLNATSTLGEGSCFTLKLPLIEAGSGPNAHVPTLSETAIALSGGHRILLAEDHDINRILATAMLENCGQEVVHAANGKIAVDLVLEADRGSAPFDLVLMDVQMPEMDGYEAALAIRDAGIDAERLPIVALTANAYDEDRAAATSAGMQGHLAKPLRFEELAEGLAQFLPDRTPSSPSPTKDRSMHIFPDRPASEAPPMGQQPDAGAVSPSPALAERWRMRRKEALEAVATLVRSGSFTGESAAEVARTVHKLAGTAAMFGESDLGELASDLELALKGDRPAHEAPPIAQQLLDRAA